MDLFKFTVYIMMRLTWFSVLNCTKLCGVTLLLPGIEITLKFTHPARVGVFVFECVAM